MCSTNITPGVVEVPLNVPGPEYADLTLTYDFKELIGTGGFGEVWRTLSRGTGEWREHVTKVSFEPTESDRVKLALYGTMAVARQPPHPHLCKPGSVSRVNGRLWVSSEFAEANMACIAAAGPDRLPELVRYTQEAAVGLDYLHRHGLVHNRVKPSNILIMGGRAAIGDFDLVHPIRLSGGSRWVYRYGDRASLAPEIASGQLCTASDQFALACAYATVRLGQPIFSRGTARGKPKLGKVPARERAVLLRALAADPDRRFQSCRAFADELASSTEPLGATDRERGFRFWDYITQWRGRHN